MIHQFRFYKEETNQWYVDIPDFPGLKEELEMVAGADTLLDIYAEGKKSIHIFLSLTEQPRFDSLLFLEEDELKYGAFYKVQRYNEANDPFQIWLCSVTLYVFGEFPKVIYIKAAS